MSGLVFGALTAAWLGILTSISPCPLATNVAAISFISRRVGRRRLVLLAGALYTLGRTLTYLALGVVIVAGLLAIPAVSYILQHYMHRLIGPLLILVGMFLLELISFRFGRGGVSEGMQHRAEAAGIWGAGLLGIVFALTFCPVSAALFFGSLIPLCIEHNSRVLLPVVYGIGTALPVVVFALIIAFSAEWLGRAYNILTTVERWARTVTGVIFILIGIYFSLHYIYGVI